jgi:hypothetical protein
MTLGRYQILGNRAGVTLYRMTQVGTALTIEDCPQWFIGLGAKWGWGLKQANGIGTFRASLWVFGPFLFGHFSY